MSDPRPNLRLGELDGQRCVSCKHSVTNDDECTYCMFGSADGATTADGQRVNQNYVCDNFE